MVKRISLSGSEFWEGVFAEFRAAHPSRTWPEATIVAYLAELGYRAWSGVGEVRIEPVVASGPSLAAKPSVVAVQPFESPMKEVAGVVDDGFPFEGML